MRSRPVWGLLRSSSVFPPGPVSVPGRRKKTEEEDGVGPEDRDGGSPSQGSSRRLSLLMNQESPSSGSGWGVPWVGDGRSEVRGESGGPAKRPSRLPPVHLLRPHPPLAVPRHLVDGTTDLRSLSGFPSSYRVLLTSRLSLRFGFLVSLPPGTPFPEVPRRPTVPGFRSPSVTLYPRTDKLFPGYPSHPWSGSSSLGGERWGWG